MVGSGASGAGARSRSITLPPDAFAAAKASGGRVIERDLAPAPEAPEPTMMLDVRWRRPSDQYADSLGAMIDGASSCCA